MDMEIYINYISLTSHSLMLTSITLIIIRNYLFKKCVRCYIFVNAFLEIEFIILFQYKPFK